MKSLFKPFFAESCASPRAVRPVSGTSSTSRDSSFRNAGTAATIARHLADQEISLESIVQRHAKDASEEETKSGAVPVILITYATTEDAVRKALAAVGNADVISGKAQVIRIEKN